MRAPSTELLRALHHALHTPAKSIHRAATLRTSCRTISPSSAPLIRPFSTSLAPRVDGAQVPKRVQSESVPQHQTQYGERRRRNPYAPTHQDRGPRSTEDTQTDFGSMDVLGHIAAPATSIDACTTDGFHLDNGVRVTGGSAIVLVGGEAWGWRPWEAQKPDGKISDLLDARRGLLHFPSGSLGLLELLYPKPDLLIVGTGSRLWMLSQENRQYVAEVLGCKLDVMDTGNASAAYNLLAKERGVEGGGGVGGLFLPLGWKGPSTR